MVMYYLIIFDSTADLTVAVLVVIDNRSGNSSSHMVMHYFIVFDSTADLTLSILAWIGLSRV